MLVLDAAAAMAAVLPQRHSDAARDLLLRVADDGAVVPAIWHLEVGNILLAAERRGILDAGQRAAVFAHLATLPIAVDAETAARAWGETLSLAQTYALSLHDAAYLELARRRDVALATFDAALLRAASVAGVRTL
jgi:predicted nucleic acid-binding protein